MNERALADRLIKRTEKTVKRGLLIDVAKEYGLNVEELVEKFGNTETVIEKEVTQCNGKLKNGKQCKSKAQENGYCGKHKKQFVPKLILSKITKSHNHLPDAEFHENCEMCQEEFKNNTTN